MSEHPTPAVTHFGAHVRLERLGPVATIVMDRSQRRNAVDRQMAEDLRTAFDVFEAEGDSRTPGSACRPAGGGGRRGDCW